MVSAWLIEQIFIEFRPQNYQQTAVTVQPSSVFDKNIQVHSRKAIAFVCCTLGYAQISDGSCVVTDSTKRGEGIATTNKGAHENLPIPLRFGPNVEWKNLGQKVSNASIMEWKKMFPNPIPISKRKFDDLQAMKDVIPQNYHHFYNNLPFANA